MAPDREFTRTFGEFTLPPWATLLAIFTWFLLLRIVLEYMLNFGNMYSVVTLVFLWMLISISAVISYLRFIGASVVFACVALSVLAKLLLGDSRMCMSLLAFASGTFCVFLVHAIGSMLMHKWRFDDTCASTFILGIFWFLSSPDTRGEVNAPLSGIFCFVACGAVSLSLASWSVHRLWLWGMRQGNSDRSL